MHGRGDFRQRSESIEIVLDGSLRVIGYALMVQEFSRAQFRREDLAAPPAACVVSFREETSNIIMEAHEIFIV